MKLTLDGAAVEISLNEEATLSDALLELKNKAGDEGRLLVSAVLDGRDIAYDGEEAVHAELVSKYENLSVQTDTAINICLKVLNELQSFKKPLQENQQKTVELIGQATATAHEEGIAILRDCFDIWNILSESVRKVTMMLALSPEEIKYKGKAVSILFEEYGKLVAETRAAIEAKDLAKLTSLIKTGWQKEVETWQGVIKAMIKVVEDLVSK